MLPPACTDQEYHALVRPMTNRFGSIFSITTWGESHGPSLGVVIDGCPANIDLIPKDFTEAMQRRRPGKLGTSPRTEPDVVHILSGTYEGRTTGAPISLQIFNTQKNSTPYHQQKHIYRPGHAQYAYTHKYGLYDPLGGGRASARETACRVAAGVVAQKVLSHYGIHVLAFVSNIGPLQATPPLIYSSDLVQEIHSAPFFSPLPYEETLTLLTQLQEEGDSIGGTVSFVTTPIPTGLGEPLFDKIPAVLAHALMSIPAAKGFEIGLGFASSHMRGSEYNDPFILDADQNIHLGSNHCGGSLGGISVGQPLYGSVAFKPTSSIRIPCMSVTTTKQPIEYTTPPTGWHDPCVAIRAVPVVEAMIQLSLVDLLLRQRCAQL